MLPAYTLKAGWRLKHVLPRRGASGYPMTLRPFREKGWSSMFPATFVDSKGEFPVAKSNERNRPFLLGTFLSRLSICAHC